MWSNWWSGSKPDVSPWLSEQRSKFTKRGGLLGESAPPFSLYINDSCNPRWTGRARVETQGKQKRRRLNSTYHDWQTDRKYSIKKKVDQLWDRQREAKKLFTSTLNSLELKDQPNRHSARSILTSVTLFCFCNIYFFTSYKLHIHSNASGRTKAHTNQVQHFFQTSTAMGRAVPQWSASQKYN